MHLANHLLGQAERQCHAGAADRGDDANAGRGVDCDPGLLGMFGVNAVPSLRNRQIGRHQEFAHVSHDEVVDFSFVENVDGETVLVRVAERQRAVGRLRDERVNGEAIVVGQLAGDALLILRQVIVQISNAG